MRVLVTIPHFFSNPAASELPKPGKTEYGSFQSGREKRLACLNACIESVLLAGSSHLYELVHAGGRAGSAVVRRRTGWQIDIMMAVHGDHHLSDVMSCRDRVEVTRHDVHPKLLGFVCQKLMAQRRKNYDFFVFFEDDLVIGDPEFFGKQHWFRETFGGDAGVLQPNRYEVGPNATRVYVDGDLPAWVKRPPPPSGPHRLAADWMGRSVAFERRDNPMSGMFFLSAAQLDQWANSPIFYDNDMSYIGPLESANILGPLKLFPIYKPAFANATFLDVLHADPRLTANPVAMQTFAKAIPAAGVR